MLVLKHSGHQLTILMAERPVTRLLSHLSENQTFHLFPNLQYWRPHRWEPIRLPMFSDFRFLCISRTYLNQTVIIHVPNLRTLSHKILARQKLYQESGQLPHSSEDLESQLLL